GGLLGMHQDPDAFDLGSDLFEQPQPFFDQRRLPIGEPGDVAGGARFVIDKTGTDWITDTYENIRYGADFRLNNPRHQIGIGDQQVRCEAHQLRENGAYSAGIPPGKPDINT